MKKLLYCAAALATLLFAGSCQRENLEPAQESAAVTFTVEAPAALQTRAIADGLNVNELIYEVWLTETLGDLTQNAQKLYQAKTDMAVDNGVNKATLTLDLVNDQKFTVLFWAQVKEAAAYTTAKLTEVTYAKNEYNSNDESLAAFYAVAYVNDSKHVEKDGTTAADSKVSLRRPFAQLNLGTLNTSTAYTVALEKSMVTVENVNTVFNVATSEATQPVAKTFKMAAVPTESLSVNGTTYEYVAMNYMFAGDNISVSYDIETTLNGTSAHVTNTVSSVPLKENYRTNIIGNLLTSKVDYEIVVDADFNEPDTPVVIDGWAHVSGFDYVVNGDAGKTALAEILAHADAAAATATKAADGPVVNINLNGDVYWVTESGHGSSPLLPATSKISKVVLNGNGNTFTATGAGVGSIRLANGGLLEFNEVNVVDKTVSYKESAWEFTYLEFAGNLAFNECTFNNGVQFQTEGEEADLSASFEDCRFISNEESVYAVWISDGTTTFNGCSFEGTRGLKMHEAYGSDVKSVTIDGCWFGPLSEKPGIAIGTLNADTKVSVTNSKFSGCQVGEQNITTYETDTDTSTFGFEFENNEVFENQNAMLNDALTDAQAGDVVEVPAGEYTFPAADAFKEGVTLNCAEGTVFKGNSKANINGATVIGATFSNPGGTAVDQTVNGTFKDCVFEGKNGLRWCYAGETAVFENCVFSGSTYGAHFDGGANDILFKNCTFSGFNTFGGEITLVTFDGCTFKPNGKSGYNGANLWGSTKMNNTEFIFDGTTTYEWIDCISSDKTYEFEGCTINGGSALNPDYINSSTTGTKIVFDGVEYIYKEGDYLASSAEAIVTNTKALAAALKTDISNINLISGEYQIDFYNIDNKDELNIKGSEGTKVEFNNLQVRASQFNTLTIENCEIMRMPNKSWGHLVFGASNNANGVYTISNCTFNGVGTQGIYINERVSGATYNILNCTFNGDFGGEGAVTI